MKSNLGQKMIAWGPMGAQKGPQGQKICVNLKTCQASMEQVRIFHEAILEKKLMEKSPKVCLKKIIIT